jgi:hypothetical protein
MLLAFNRRAQRFIRETREKTMKRIVACWIVFLVAAASASAFDYGSYWDKESEGAFYNNLEIGVDGLVAMEAGAPSMIPGFHMDWNMAVVPIPTAFHFDMNMASVDDSLLMVFGMGIEPFDLLGPNNTLGAGLILGFLSSTGDTYFGPYGRWVYRLTSDLVADGMYLDMMLHADLGYAFDMGQGQSLPVVRLGICVGIITVSQGYDD